MMYPSEPVQKQAALLAEVPNASAERLIEIAIELNMIGVTPANVLIMIPMLAEMRHQKEMASTPVIDYSMLSSVLSNALFDHFGPYSSINKILDEISSQLIFIKQKMYEG